MSFMGSGTGVRNPQIAMHLIRKITAVLIIDRGAVPCTVDGGPAPGPARGARAGSDSSGREDHDQKMKNEGGEPGGVCFATARFYSVNTIYCNGSGSIKIRGNRQAALSVPRRFSGSGMSDS